MRRRIENREGAGLAHALLIALVAMTWVPLIVAFAQAQPSGPVFRSSADLVVLSATAVDRKGRPVRDLKPDEVRIYDEGRLQPVRHFSRGRELSARVLLLIDASGSMSGDLKSASTRMAVLQVTSVLGPDDEVALAAFDDRYMAIQAFTRDKQKVLQAFETMVPYGSTALHDALEQGALEVASRGEGRRAVIVITDGIDTSSQRTADHVIARSRALDVPIYALSVVSPIDDPGSDYYTGSARKSAAAAGHATLERYADMSGGAAFIVSDFRALKLAADQIASELSFQYRLGYESPADAGPRFRRVEVRTTRKGVVVRTRSGYVPQS
jgi:Ca-activated chloride channel family protein